MTRLIQASTLVLGLLLAGCADLRTTDQVLDEGAVVAGAPQDSEGGIGGTGAPRQQVATRGDETEGGIGGTGILGTVTAFGSIIVNGQTIDFEDDDVVSERSALGQDLPLTVGAAVIVEAEAEGGTWLAERVSIFLPVVGPVGAIDREGRKIDVMGTPVVIDDGTIIADRRGDSDGSAIAVDDLSPDDRLAVSGLWKGGEVIASRIDRLDSEGPHSLRGLLLDIGDGPVVGGTALGTGCCESVPSPNYVNLLGAYRDGRFEVERIEAGAPFLFSDRVSRLVVEAFLARDPDGEGFHLSGFGIPADQASDVTAEEGVRSLFVGDYGDAFRIERSIPLSESGSARAVTLDALGNLAPQD